jgi:hypothetical protein
MKLLEKLKMQTSEISTWDARQMRWKTYMFSPNGKDYIQFFYEHVDEDNTNPHRIVTLIYKGQVNETITIPCSIVDDTATTEYNLGCNEWNCFPIVHARYVWNYLYSIGWIPTPRWDFGLNKP